MRLLMFRLHLSVSDFYSFRVKKQVVNCYLPYKEMLTLEISSFVVILDRLSIVFANESVKILMVIIWGSFIVVRFDFQNYGVATPSATPPSSTNLEHSSNETQSYIREKSRWTMRIFYYYAGNCLTTKTEIERNDSLF